MTPRKASPATRTVSRKHQHVTLAVTRNVQFRGKTTGLESVDLLHNALPELDRDEIDLSTAFLGRTIGAPIMVSCMTGGYPGALAINRHLATACEELRLPLGVGSQRQALENSRFHRTFSIVREMAPSIPIIGNIGAAEVARLNSPEPLQKMVDLLRADAFAVHLNPVQELVQQEGTPSFRGVLAGITMLVRGLSVPVMVKEIGAGLSPDVIRRLLDAGVRIVDVAGAGGTSWAGVESLRRNDPSLASRLWDWGIPTVEALRGAAALKHSGRSFTLIASGGIASGIDIAKCIALGADLGASARPVLAALIKNGERGLRRLLASWQEELRAAMFLTGSRTIADLQHAEVRG